MIPPSLTNASKDLHFDLPQVGTLTTEIFSGGSVMAFTYPRHDK